MVFKGSFFSFLRYSCGINEEQNCSSGRRPPAAYISRPPVTGITAPVM